MPSLQFLDPVVALVNMPEANVRKGSLGTIVEVFPDGTFLVEFADTNGVMYALPVLPADALMKVYQEPVAA